MNGRTFSTIYVINIVIESIFTMLFSVGISVLAGWLLVNRLGTREWVFVPLILMGIAIGFLSMFKLIGASMRALERIERDRADEGKITKDNQQIKR